jgi:hypothetical protein
LRRWWWYPVPFRGDADHRAEAGDGSAAADLVAERSAGREFCYDVAGDQFRPGAAELALRVGGFDNRRHPRVHPAAYALSRYRFAGRGAYRQFLLISQMLSPIVLVLGLFRLLASFKLLDNLNSVALVYAAFNIAFTVWMLQSYFSTIPRISRKRRGWRARAGPRRWSRFSCRLPSRQ